jgi:formiminoglutamase
MTDDPMWPRADALLTADAAGAQIALLGVPTHRTSISATQAHHTPAAVRSALHRFSVQHAMGSIGDARILDAGDVPDPDDDPHVVAERVRALCAAGKFVIALGGDNAATVGVALGAFGNQLDRAGLVTLDAHHDLRDGVSNGSPVRQLIEAGLDGRRVVQIGISDFANSPAYAARARDLGITVISRADLRTTSISAAMAQALEHAGSAGGPVHVDFDVDVCDQSVAPACPAATPGGISADELRQAAWAAGAHRAVHSVDITEVDARADAADQRTVRLAALCVLELVAGRSHRDRSAT